MKLTRAQMAVLKPAFDKIKRDHARDCQLQGAVMCQAWAKGELVAFRLEDEPAFAMLELMRKHASKIHRLTPKPKLPARDIPAKEL